MKDKKEKNRKLTEAERHRLDRYEAVSAKYAAEGFRRTELTIGIVAANIYSIALGLPLSLAGCFLFFVLNPETELKSYGLGELIVFLILMILLTVLHELVHGITWSFFTKNHWKDIDFGFMWQYLTPYCACSCPLSRGEYILGALMPLILVGLVPAVTALFAGSWLIFLLGLVMTMSAGGDVLLVLNILKYKSSAAHVFYMDHPTQAGGVIFEKEETTNDAAYRERL